MTIGAAAAVTAAGVTAVLAAGAALRPRLVDSRSVTPPRARAARRPCPTVIRRGALVAAVLVGGAVFGPLAAAAGAAAVFMVRRARPVLAVRARRRAIERGFPEALDLLILGIRAGLTPRQSIGTLIDAAPPPIAEACAAVIHRTDRGRTFADALAALPEMLGPTAAGLADAIASCERYGLPLEPLLDRLGTDARDARRRLAEADARRLPVRLSFPLVMCTLPSFVLLAIAPAVIAALSSLGLDHR